MEFGAFVPQGWLLDLVGIPLDQQWAAMRTTAERLDEAGYRSAWVFDHFHTRPQTTQEVTYEAWTLMSALAASTSRIRLGQMCTCNHYRPPAYLAKVASSIDVISGGRLEMGIGAGWFEEEFHAYGYGFPKGSVRIAMLGEAVEIMLAMWTEDEVHYDGTYYRLSGAINQPKGIQQPHIPLWIAGGGERLTLNVAARYADYTNFGNTVDEFRHKSEVLAGHCREVGREYDEIVRSSNFTVVCGATESEVEQRKQMLIDKVKNLVSDRALGTIQRTLDRAGGTPEQHLERLRPWAEAGCTYAIVRFPDVAYDPAGAELFAREVMPALAASAGP